MSTFYIPYGLLCIAKPLIDNGYDVEILDFFDLWNEQKFNLDLAIKFFKQNFADIYGFYVCTFCFLRKRRGLAF